MQNLKSLRSVFWISNVAWASIFALALWIVKWEDKPPTTLVNVGCQSEISTTKLDSDAKWQITISWWGKTDSEISLNLTAERVDPVTLSLTPASARISCSNTLYG